MILETSLCGQPPLCGEPNPLNEQVHLAAEAVIKGCVQERGGQGERGEQVSERRNAGQESDGADGREYHADALSEAGRGLRLGPRRWPEPWLDQVPVYETVGVVAQAGQRPHGEHKRLSEEEPATRGEQYDREHH